MRPVGIAAVVLAAGSSRRLGRPKQNVFLGGETLLARALRTATVAGLYPLAAVVRELHGTDQLASLHAVVLPNDHADEGIAASLRLGVRWASQAGVAGLVILTCDQPLLQPDHLQALCAEPARLTASAYGTRRGVPAFFPAAAFPLLLTLTGDAGARDLLQDAAAIPNEDLALDIDTEADLRRAEEFFAAEVRRGPSAQV